MQEKNAQTRLAELENKIKELKDRLPAHSIPAIMLEELDDLEKELRSLKEGG